MTGPNKRPGRRGDDDAELPLSRTPRVDEDVRGEIEFHIAERAAELEARGTPRERALAEARELFGDRESIESECRTIEQRRRHTKGRAFRFRSLRQDLVVGLRMLRKTPGFTLAAVLTLAVGIGANAAVFSIVNETILRPLPFANADRLAYVSERHGQGRGNVPWANFLDLEKSATSFTAMASYGASEATVLGGASPVRVGAAAVSSGFFDVFALKPARGRLPAPAEHREGANPVAVVSHAFWRDALGSPQSLRDVRIRLDMTHDVIGVLPPEFSFPEGTQVWTALEIEAQPTSRTAHNWEVVGRMRDGIAAADAQRELDLLLGRMRPLHYPDFDADGATVTPLQDALTANLRTPLYLLFAASTVLLLAACTNLASAQLARGTARAGELAVRAALGAGRLRLIRQLLTESALLAVLGALAGLLLARLLLGTFAIVAPAQYHLERVSIDASVLAFALCVAMVTSVVFGLYPALRLSETNTSLALRQGGRGAVGRGGGRVWNLLVASEIALAVMLLAGSVVLVRSFAEVMATDLGFDHAGVATARVNLPAVNYADSSTTTPQFHEAALERLRAVGGIRSAGFANVLPLEGANPSGAMEVEGKPLDSRGPFNGNAVYRVVGGDYFSAMGIRLIEGRTLQASDDGAAPRVVVVNEQFAREQWPGQSPIGRRVRPAGMDMSTPEPWHTVVGVVADSRAESITAPFRATYYFDHRQRRPSRTRSVSYVVRSSLETSSAAATIRRELTSVDPQVPIEGGTMSRLLERAVADRRFMMLLLGAFASMALLLALVGIYSVVSYTVAQRTREIGVRLALGASPAQVLRLVVRSAMHGVIPGLVAGGLLALTGVRALRSMLYGVSPQDPVALLSAIALLGLVGLLSTLIPARRATRVDPIIAMRAE